MTNEVRGDADSIRLHLLVLRCQSGDERAFTSLFEEFQPKTLGYLRGIVADAADDVQQDLWLSVYRNVSSLANPGAFRTWLFTATRRHALNWLRGRKRERELVVDVPLEMVDVAIADEEPRAFDGIDSAALAAALAGLPPPQREVLLLRYKDDLSYTEIAIVIGTTVGTVRSRLHYAKRNLEALLKGEAP
jgi:RNA polymerase sigma-70 factor (ECF subfamily)